MSKQTLIEMINFVLSGKKQMGEEENFSYYWTLKSIVTDNGSSVMDVRVICDYTLTPKGKSRRTLFGGYKMSKSKKEALESFYSLFRHICYNLTRKERINDIIFKRSYLNNFEFKNATFSFTIESSIKIEIAELPEYIIEMRNKLINDWPIYKELKDEMANVKTKLSKFEEIALLPVEEKEKIVKDLLNNLDRAKAINALDLDNLYKNYSENLFAFLELSSLLTSFEPDWKPK